MKAAADERTSEEGKDIKCRRNPEGTRRRILDAAITEFTTGGFAGARVDRIAKRALTNERMLYYYFGSKEKMFIAVLERTYGGFVAAQAELKLQTLSPVSALKAFVHFVWDYCYKHPEVVRLINNENLHEGQYLRKSGSRGGMKPVIGVLADILQRGAQAGDFRADVDAMRFYLSVSALGYYVVSNRHTLAATLGRDFGAPDEHRQVVDQNMEMLLAYLQPGTR